MLAAKRSAGITPEVNLRIVLHTGDEAYKPGDPTLALKRMLPEVQKQEYQWPHKNDMMPSIIFLKNLS